ncbi:MAG: Orotidine 5'-phosphate decarboxylase [Firmicutes bacterium ADurb.Bin099]|nr:MAG: Orotidine 5'-phosphate decarboxylase [Firmicutes bacterium ADurb.Bin099]
MKKDVIVACDFPSRSEVMEFLQLFGKRKPFVKIGMELFYSEGPEIVREIKKRGYKIFLDLKLHDIPNTVERAMRSLSMLDIDMVNLHTAGTIKMMQAALRGLVRPDGTRPILIGVTQLTSTDEKELKEQLLVNGAMDDVVIAYAKLGVAAGIDGVVCSPLEAGKVKKECGETFLTVTPGIRFKDSKKDDQARITTPYEASRMGCDYIVVGRPVTQATDPVGAYERCIREFVYGKESE